MTQDLTAALTDVRRAYRLLWAYQKRVTQCVTFIRDRLSFEHSHVDYQFRLPKNDIEHHWAWDGLPLVLASFVSTKPAAEDGSTGNKREKRQQESDLLLFIEIISDTALEACLYEDDWQHEPDAAELGQPESSNSELRLYLAKLHAGRAPSIASPKVVVQRINNEGRWPENGQTMRNAGIGIDIYVEYIDLATLGDQDCLAERVDLFAENAARALSVVL